MLMVQLWLMVGEGPIDEVLDSERLGAVYVDCAFVVGRSHHLAVVAVHASRIAVQALEDFGPIDEGLDRRSQLFSSPIQPPFRHAIDSELRAVKSLETRHLFDRPARSWPESLTGTEPSDREEASLHVRIRNAEQRADLSLVNEVEGGDARAVTPRPQCESKVLDRGEDRPVQRGGRERTASRVLEIRLIARKHEQRNFTQVVHKPFGRCHDAAKRSRTKRFLARLLSSGMGEVGVLVQVGDLAPELRITHHYPAPRLHVRSIGCLTGDAQTITDLVGIEGHFDVEQPAY